MIKPQYNLFSALWHNFRFRFSKPNAYKYYDPNLMPKHKAFYAAVLEPVHSEQNLPELLKYYRRDQVKIYEVFFYQNKFTTRSGKVIKIQHVMGWKPISTNNLLSSHITYTEWRDMKSSSFNETFEEFNKINKEYNNAKKKYY